MTIQEAREAAVDQCRRIIDRDHLDELSEYADPFVVWRPSSTLAGTFAVRYKGRTEAAFGYTCTSRDENTAPPVSFA